MSATLIAEFTRPEVRWLEALVPEMLELPARLRRDWHRLCLTVAEAGPGRIAELHSGRDEYRKVYEGYLETLDGFQGLAEAVGSPLAARFRQAAEQLRQLKDEVFGGWNTQEDLEHKLVAELSIPQEVLRELAAKYPPPQSWYDETGNPFVADE
jgi:hypothetical protein